MVLRYAFWSGRAGLIGALGVAMALGACAGQSQTEPPAGQPRPPPGPAPAGQDQAAQALVDSRGCLECHSLDKPHIGPAFRDIAARYKDASRHGYTLKLMNAARTSDLPEKATSTIVVARVGTYLQIRVFDAAGQRIADKTEERLLGEPGLAQLKERWSGGPLADSATLPAAERQQIVDAALIATGLTQERARLDLTAKIRNGGKGNWTEISKGVPMPPFSHRLSSDEIDTLVDWVLGL